MGLVYYYDISTFVVVLCLIYAFFLQRLDKVENNTIIFASLLCSLLASGLNIACSTEILNRPELSAVFQIAIWSLTAVSIALITLFLYMGRAYNIGVVKPMLLVGVPFALDMVFIVLACFELNPLFRTAAYICDLFIFLVGISILYTYKKNTAMERTLMLNLTFGGVLISSIVEIINPEIQVQRFAIAMLLSEAFLNLKNPEDQYNVETGLMGIDTFKDEMRRRLYYIKRHGRAIYMVMLAIHSTETFLKLLGEVNEMKLRQSVMSEILRISAESSVFRVQQGVYVFMSEKGDRKEAERIMDALLTRFESTFGAEAYEMGIPFSVCMIELPRMAADMTAISDLIHMAFKEGRTYGRTVIDVDKLDLSHEEYMRMIDEKVRNAVQDGNLEVYYQPIYSLKEQRFVSAEALLRLHDGDRFIPPDVFITVAESNGSIVEIDDFVIQQVCRMISDRNINDLGIRYIELNLSVSDMLQDDIASKLKKMVETYHVHSSQINLEITETSDDTFSGVVESNVMKLSHLGFSFSLDDFGTGYSSLSRIIMMPFDIIKLDKTLVQSPFTMETESERENAMTLLVSSADMIRKISAETVAEGVETKEQLELMKELGVELIQGYYYARPMPESEFVNAVKAMNMKKK